MPVISFPATLEQSRMLSPKVKHFVFKIEQTPAFNYLPGQFITIHFQHEKQTLRRSYSIANIPAQDNRIEFAAGFIENGPGTQFLFNLKPGDEVEMSGPFGRLLLKDETPKRYILMATSTGITPYRTMLNELQKRLASNPSLEVVILQGVQRQEDVLYADEFLDFANNNPRASFKAYLSRETNPKEPYAHHGYVQHAFSHLNLNPEEDVVYLCGNPSMIDDCFEQLKNKGFTVQQIIREKYISR